MHKRIGILGNGKLAKALAQRLQATGRAPLFVAARRWTDEKREHFNDIALYTLGEDLPETDILFFCVSDSAITALAEQYSATAINIHCSGAMPLGLLPAGPVGRAVVWPVHSFTRNDTDWTNIPIAVDAEPEQNLRIVMELCESISGGMIREMKDEERKQLHLAAVFVSNFTNAMFAAAEEVLEQDKNRMQMLLPLLKDTAMRYEGTDAAELQTGPALRGDEATMARHKKYLEKYTLLNILYSAVSDYIRTLRKP